MLLWERLLGCLRPRAGLAYKSWRVSVHKLEPVDHPSSYRVAARLDPKMPQSAVELVDTNNEFSPCGDGRKLFLGWDSVQTVLEWYVGDFISLRRDY